MLKFPRAIPAPAGSAAVRILAARQLQRNNPKIQFLKARLACGTSSGKSDSSKTDWLDLNVR